MSLWPFISEQPIPMAKADLVSKKRRGTKKKVSAFGYAAKKKKSLKNVLMTNHLLSFVINIIFFSRTVHKSFSLFYTW